MGARFLTHPVLTLKTLLYLKKKKGTSLFWVSKQVKIEPVGKLMTIPTKPYL